MAITQQEAEYLLKEIIMEEQRRLQMLLQPYVHELTNIETRKPPRPVQMPDGRTAVYRGPTADDIAGPYKAPAWLEALCRDDMQLAEKLRRLRRIGGP